MPINFRKKVGKKLVKVAPPKTINEAIDRIVTNLDPIELEYVKSNDQLHQHFTTGMSIRNEWGLWKDDSPLKRDFIARFNLFGHGDDISGIILEGVWAKVRGENVDATLQKTAEDYRRHWKNNCKLDPKTGRALDGREKS